MSLATIAAGHVAYAPKANACGGLFCDSASGQLVLQAREDILFVQDGGMIEAHVAIQYQGAPDAFAWIVPVPSETTVAVGSPYLFSRLSAQLQPSFSVNWINQEFCSSPSSGDSGMGCGQLESDSAGSAGEFPRNGEPTSRL